MREIDREGGAYTRSYLVEVKMRRGLFLVGALMWSGVIVWRVWRDYVTVCGMWHVWCNYSV